MRKDTFFGKLFSEIAAILLMIAPCGLYSDGTTVSDSLKDDVTAMITSAKKMPHQIFIVDSSDSMNSFAYSDYVDNCKDAISNIAKGLALCNNAYTQCRNVENNAMCSVDLNCGSITPKCNQIRSTKTKLEQKCNEITNKKYPEPGMFETVSSIDDSKAKKYIGPWDPRRKDYKQDLCFYNWVADSNADVLEGNSSAEAYNKQKYCDRHGYSGATCDTKFEQFLQSSGGFIAARSDWDCITDGSDKITHTNNTSPNSTYYLSRTGGVSGLWLNWKYATSLDAVKIILADTHQFSVQPRYRGANKCYETKYLPYYKYTEAVLDPDGNPVYDADGNPTFEEKYACFTSFDPSLAGEADRATQLESLKTTVETTWTPGTVTEVEANNCTGFDIEKDFALYNSGNYTSHVSEVATECGKCMKWTPNSDGTGSFTETKCKSFNGTGVTDDLHTKDLTLGTVSGSLSKECCKTFQCTNPKCRDNDLCCKNNEAAFPTDDGSEEYQLCRGGSGYSCSLGFYSEYDQDSSHCCSETTCAEYGEIEEYTSGSTTCQTCKNGSVMGDSALEQYTDVVNVIETAVGNASCGLGSSEDECDSIPVIVGIKESDASSIPFDDVSSIQIKVFYDCIFDDEDHTVTNTEYPSLQLGTGTCTTAADCVDLVSGSLSGCDKKGYRMAAQVTVTRSNCKFDKLDLEFDLVYSFGEKDPETGDLINSGYTAGNFINKNIFDTNFSTTDPIYHTYNLQASTATEKVYEYECRTAFYNREVIVRSGDSCPSANAAPGYINQNHQGDKVQYCEARTAEREVLARDQWGRATKVACSWLCRAAEAYEEPWKCSAMFLLMNNREHGGPNSTNIKNNCYASAMDDSNKLEECCKYIDREFKNVPHETPKGVNMTGGRYTCSMSGYQYATGSNGSRTTAGGYQAEIINGHIKEGGSDGYYNLSPYYADNDTLWSPYAAYDSDDDPGIGGWYSKYSLIHSDAGKNYLGDSFTSLFTTNDYAKRLSTCVYDLVWGWSGQDCNSGACGGGCCSIDISQNSNNCDYPAFWMKIPQGDGGRLLMNAKELTKEDHITEFRTKIKQLKAVGGSTLGETLYDAWRYLGGMYSLYDEAHQYVDDPDHPGTSLNAPYTSPFAAQDPQCFTNEAILVSGGNPQYDDNSKLEDYGVSCDTFSPNLSSGATYTSANKNAKPCVKAGEPVIDSTRPYDANNEWQKTSVQNVAQFVNRNTFWGAEECRTAPLSVNAGGFFSKTYNGTACKGNNPAADIGAEVPLIDRVHAIAIGEWGLTAMYQSLTNNAQVAGFMNASLIQNAAKLTGRDNEQGRYYTLTATGNAAGSTLGGGSFTDLTSLFTDFVNKSKLSHVVVGRPHWTSSLVQPFDVEEKYRGPEAYVAGAVPVDGSKSRFWFGNLKKYSVSSDADCPITDDTEANCGEWKKQTFGSKDCFAQDDNPTTGFDGPAGSDSVQAYQKLMVGGAAFRLQKKLEGSTCDNWPCYKSTPRNIYYDLGGPVQELKNANISALRAKLYTYNHSITDDVIAQQIFDYMAGYDAFKSDVSDRKKVRFSDGETITVDDPFNVDFNHDSTKQLTLRPLLLGAIVHSKPLAVYYVDNTNTRIYVGANDGMLHAFDADGEEVYAYIPSLAFKSISSFAEESFDIFFNASVDGPISMLHIDQSHDGIINNGEKAYLIFGYRRGASGYTVIDISDPDKPKFVQNLNTEGGLSFGKAAVFRKCSSGSCSYAEDLDYYLAVPGGYDECHDPASLQASPAVNTPTCKTSQLVGNKFTLYKFDKEQGKFTDKVTFDTSSSSKLAEADKGWLQTSFTSVPLVVNTSGKAAVDTEFVYFTDLSGTVFRADVRNNDMSKWTAKVVFTEREEKALDRVWGEINRSYVASNFYPPLERYNPSRNSETTTGGWKIPIPVVTGNAANPKYKKQEGIFVFYDTKDGSTSPVSTENLAINKDGESHSAKNTMIENKDGWQVDFNKDNGEKGITEPLIVYDIYGGGNDAEGMSNSYTIAWNTYIPMKSTECKTFGTSSNYERFMPDGAQAFTDTSLSGANGEWSVTNDTTGKCISDSSNISLATSVGIIATDEGYDLTFGAGADIFRKEKLTVKKNSTYIIKWYELY